MARPTSVLPHDFRGINVHSPKRIHGNQYQSRVGVNNFLEISNFNAMQYSGSKTRLQIALYSTTHTRVNRKARLNRLLLPKWVNRFYLILQKYLGYSSIAQ